jgi:hypothetical protein
VIGPNLGWHSGYRSLNFVVVFINVVIPEPISFSCPPFWLYILWIPQERQVPPQFLPLQTTPRPPCSVWTPAAVPCCAVYEGALETPAFCSVAPVYVAKLPGRMTCIFIRRLHHEDVCGSGCMDPHFLALYTSSRPVVSFKIRPLYPCRKESPVHFREAVGWITASARFNVWLCNYQLFKITSHKCIHVGSVLYIWREQ